MSIYRGMGKDESAQGRKAQKISGTYSVNSPICAIRNEFSG
jgi:hypothetical protein